MRAATPPWQEGKPKHSGTTYPDFVAFYRRRHPNVYMSELQGAVYDVYDRPKLRMIPFNPVSRITGSSPRIPADLAGARARLDRNRAMNSSNPDHSRRIKVGACQTLDIREDVEAALAVME